MAAPHYLSPVGVFVSLGIFAAGCALSSQSLAEAPKSDAPTYSFNNPYDGLAAPQKHRYQLVEEFTALTLHAGEIKLGTDMEVGLSPSLMLGTDLVATIVGAPTIHAKVQFWQNGQHALAFNLRLAYLDQDLLLWGTVREHFDKLEAKIARPGISWSNRLSERLSIHMFWAKGFGELEAELSEKGRRELWKAKHPGENYEERDAAGAPTASEDDKADEEAINTKRNQEKEDPASPSALAQRSLQVQSIAGLAQDRFQMIGEFRRQNGNKVLIASRIEQTVIEDLRSNAFRMSLSHHWVWAFFQMRLGIGLEYFVITGKDLDDEEIDETGVQPAADVVFYWRL